ncbi:mary1-like reverse transcriptase [Moniliophthora roreri MCA 2997]|uniref:Mary1-like reverse transcriptase n=1 Tax=Moniliophthora roreri (strain MCA 2997) TaxID=1381753 RepID=V2W4T3_MONRO|nr:mary1-like reverse transcriptase [Moniliophthora roreri MCA 2997]
MEEDKPLGLLNGKVVIYMDDILVFTKTLKEHCEMVRRILRKLHENKLYLKPEKCIFEALKVEFLGLIIRKGQVKMDPNKVKAVTSWPTPDYFGKSAKPLTKLTRKNNWEWTDDQQQAFEELKMKVTSASVLVIPNNRDQFRVEADSSDFTIGAVLSQFQDNKWKPVALLSHVLNETERNYEIYDKEMLAIITALKEWRQYLLGSQKEFKIWSDHKNLKYF